MRNIFRNPFSGSAVKFQMLALSALLGASCAPTITDPQTSGPLVFTQQFSQNVSTVVSCGDIIPKGTSGVKESQIVWHDSSGRLDSLSNHRGKIILLNFWGTWCVPCQNELPGLNKIATDLAADSVEVIGIAEETSTRPFETVQLYASGSKLRYQMVVDSAARIFKNWAPIGDPSGGVPQSFTIDRNGFVRYINLGYTENQTFRDQITSLK